MYARRRHGRACPGVLVLTAQPDQLIALRRTQGLALFLPAALIEINLPAAVRPQARRARACGR
jgi:hypothetical protein